MHLLVTQSKEQTETQINNNVITKIYNIICEDERLGIGSYIDINSNFSGKINTEYTYKKFIDKINEKFVDLEIGYRGLYVYFEDKKVEQILIDNFAQGNQGILATQLFHPTNGFYTNKQIFNNNTEIETFDELGQLQYADILGEYSFDGCINLKSIDLSNIKTIRLGAFRKCTGLEMDINAPKLNSLGNHAFRESAITGIDNLGNVTQIPLYCFYQCQGLTEISNSVLSRITSIGENAFAGCYFLTSIDDLSSLTLIDYGAFDSCNRLESFPFNENITTINANAFKDCITLSINSLNLPNLTSLGQRAFQNTLISNIQDLSKLTIIPQYAFTGCTILSSIHNDALINVESIGDSTFNGGKFSTINIPKIQSISNSAFAGNTNLTTVNMGDQQQITRIGWGAFKDCNSLEFDDLNLTSLTSLDSYAFSGTKVKQISSLGNITTIPDNVFNGCTELRSVSDNVLLNVNYIKSRAFQNCSSLTSINLSNITRLGANAFRECANLTNIGTDLHNLTTYDCSDSMWDLVFSETSIENDIVLSGLLDSCTTNPGILVGVSKIRSFTLSSGKAQNLGGSRYTDHRQYFGNNPNLLYVDVSKASSLTTIVGMSFNGCAKLKMLILPPSITYFGRRQVSECHQLESIILPCNTPPPGNDLPSGFPAENALLHNSTQSISVSINDTFKIYVPDNSITTYQSTEYWSVYAEYYAPISELSNLEQPEWTNNTEWARIKQNILDLIAEVNN